MRDGIRHSSPRVVLKSHMYSCQSGEHVTLEKNYRERYKSDNATLTEMLGSIGNC